MCVKGSCDQTPTSLVKQGRCVLGLGFTWTQPKNRFLTRAFSRCRTCLFKVRTFNLLGFLVFYPPCFSSFEQATSHDIFSMVRVKIRPPDMGDWMIPYDPIAHPKNQILSQPGTRSHQIHRCSLNCSDDWGVSMGAYLCQADARRAQISAPVALSTQIFDSELPYFVGWIWLNDDFSSWNPCFDRKNHHLFLIDDEIWGLCGLNQDFHGFSAGEILIFLSKTI